MLSNHLLTTNPRASRWVNAIYLAPSHTCGYSIPTISTLIYTEILSAPSAGLKKSLERTQGRESSKKYRSAPHEQRPDRRPERHQGAWVGDMNNTTIFVLIFIISFIFGAMLHEADIYRTCKNKGHSGSAMWMRAIQCSPIDEANNQ